MRLIMTAVRDSAECPHRHHVGHPVTGSPATSGRDRKPPGRSLRPPDLEVFVAANGCILCAMRPPAR